MTGEQARAAETPDTDPREDEDETPDITELSHKRDSDGELLPVEQTIEVRGEGEATLKVIPATAGQRNEWQQRLEGAGDEVEGELRDELFDEFLPYDSTDFGADEWGDIRPALEDAMATAIFAEVFDTSADAMGRALQQAMEDVAGAGEGN